jgi:hypothetical protein
MVAAVIAIGLLFGAGKLRDLVSGSLEQLAGGNALKVQSCPPGEACNARAQDRPGGAGESRQPLGVGVR